MDSNLWSRVIMLLILRVLRTLEAYEKAYGGIAWDDRIKLLENAVIRRKFILQA
jgi:hypothetical protein